MPVVAGAYVLVYAVQPDAFDFSTSALALLAPTLGAAGGLVAMVLTLVAGDGAASALGSKLG